MRSASDAARRLEEPSVPTTRRAHRAVARSRSFTPSRLQRRYLEVWLDPTQPKTVTAIAKELGITRRSICYWFADLGFKGWFEAEVDAATRHVWQAALLRCSQLALGGSAEHFKLLAQIRGVLGRENGVDQARSITVALGVPRPARIHERPE
jgi:hypothetical protein